MPNTSHGYYVMGWLADVRYDPLADLYEAWVTAAPTDADPRKEPVIAIVLGRRTGTVILYLSEGRVWELGKLREGAKRSGRAGWGEVGKGNVGLERSLRCARALPSWKVSIQSLS